MTAEPGSAPLRSSHRLTAHSAVGISRTSQTSVAGLNSRRKVRKKSRMTDASVCAAMFRHTRYSAVVAAPAVTTGMHKKIHRIFRIIRSATRDKNRISGASGSNRRLTKTPPNSSPPPTPHPAASCHKYTIQTSTLHPCLPNCERFAYPILKSASRYIKPPHIRDL